MRNIILVLLLFFGLIDNSFAFQNEPDGFREIKWGADITALPDMEFKLDYTSDFGGIKIYTRRDDELKIGGAVVGKIEYYFWRDQFYMMKASTEDLINSNQLFQACLHQFGDRMDIIAGVSYTWKGLVTKIVVTERDLHGNYIYMESTELGNLLKPLKLQKEKERAATGF